MKSVTPLNFNKQASTSLATDHRRVIVVGLDGATWNLLDPLLAQTPGVSDEKSRDDQAGTVKLPILAQLLKNGVRANLRSCIQPSSEQAWSAFATGKQNGKFGLYGFYQRAPNSYALEYINAAHRRAPTLWRLLSNRGKRCVVVNVPLTWPVEPVNGALVSGLMTPGVHSQFTYPPALRAELFQELGEYIIDVDIERGETELGSLADLVDQVRRMSELQTRATRWLLQKNPDWDFAMLVHRAPDILCHKFWRYQDPSHPLYHAQEAEQWGSVIADAFQYLDAQLGELLESVVDARTSVIVLSDHGFGPLTHAVYLNRYFAQRGLLTYRAQSGSPWRSALRAGVRRLNNPAVNWAKQRAFELLPSLKSSLHYSMAYGNIDWSRTRAFAIGTMGNVYLNVRGREPQGIVEPNAYEQTRAQVIAAMRELTDPETHSPIFDAVYRREEIYAGPALDQAPDVVGLIDGPYHVAAVDWRGKSASRGVIEKVGSDLLFVSDTSGQHRMDGILAAAGAGIAAQARFISPPQLIDIAPTILQLLGEPVPQDMDGRVLNEMLTETRAVEFSAASNVQNTPPDDYNGLTAEEVKVIEERLAGLGYLG